MRAYERFLQYVKKHTTSCEDSQTFPSTMRQIDFAKELVVELEALGLKAELDKYGYVYSEIPATKGYENVPVIGFIAHMDTAPDFSGEGVSPILHENFDGSDVILPKNNCVISPNQCPSVKAFIGKTLITADGSTLLGADDKAGIAEIITACEEILAEKTPHGTIKIGFTPDEEIGAGADHFDVERFGAEFAYTMDGDLVGGIEYENFNAASANIDITGVAVHPGSSKDIMVNAVLLASEIISELPSDQTPAMTEEYEGFIHAHDIEGNVAFANLGIIIRDHDSALFETKKALVASVCEKMQAKYPTAVIKFTLKDIYYNMKEKIEPCMHLIENAREATKMAGVVPFTKAIRGGTDGARLSFMGLPCPNLGTGGTNFHGPFECITVEDMDSAVKIIKNIATVYAQKG